MTPEAFELVEPTSTGTSFWQKVRYIGHVIKCQFNFPNTFIVMGGGEYYEPPRYLELGEGNSSSEIGTVLEQGEVMIEKIEAWLAMLAFARAYEALFPESSLETLDS